MTDAERFVTLLASEHACVRITTAEEAEALQLCRDGALETRRDCIAWNAIHGCRDALVDGRGPEPKTEGLLAASHWLTKRNDPCVFALLDSTGFLADPRALRAVRELIQHAERTDSCVVFIDFDPLPALVDKLATPFELSFPDDDELHDIVKRTVNRMHRRREVKVKISKRQLSVLLKNLRGLTRRQAERVVVGLIAEDRVLDTDDLNHVAAIKRQLVSSAGPLEYVESPASLDEVGGLRKLKQWLSDRAKSFEPEAEKFGITPPRGVLLVGVQGAGKSLCAKAIATAWSRPLLRLDPGALYDRFVGASEQRLRDTLHQAEAMAPVVLWIDEIEKGFASAAAHSTDGGLSQRMFGALLTWMQDHRAPVFLVATANNIDALPPELLRKGRFDEIFFVDLPNAAARRRIFEVHLKRRDRDPKAFDLPALAAASEGYSGAEIEQAVVSALHTAFSEKTDLDTDRVVGALRASPPLSVTMRERIEALRRWADGRCAPAG